MNEIGKRLVFYLKYYPEMVRLYEEGDEAPELDDNPDREAIMENVHEVGRTAGIEAAKLMETCTTDWLKGLESSSVANFRPCKWKTVENNWELRIDVRPHRQRNSAPLTRQIGILVVREGLIPWVWSRGGSIVEPKITKLFPPNVETFGSETYGWIAGSIGLKPIEIPWARAGDFSVDADPLITATRARLEVISPKFIEDFLNLD